MEKIKTDFLGGAKASINVALAAVPMTMTYTQAVTTFCQMVHSKYPPDIIPNRPSRRIQGPDSKRHGEGKKGKTSPHKKGKGGGKKGNYHREQYPVRLTNGKTINCHPSFSFEPKIWNLLPAEAQRRIKAERSAYKKAQADRTLASLHTQPTDCFGYPLPGYTEMVGSVATSTQYHPYHPTVPQVVQMCKRHHRRAWLYHLPLLVFPVFLHRPRLLLHPHLG